MKRIIEFIEDENGKLSSSRILTLLFGVVAVFISLYFTFANNLTSEYNILIGILISSALGNKIVSNIADKNK